MAKNVMKAFDEFYTEAFGQSEAILTSLENGAQISDEVRVRTLMSGLKKISDRVLDNVKATQKREFKSAVKDYSNYYKEYPTIHHLISELMDNKESHDAQFG